MPKGILGYNIGLGNRDSAIYRSIVELIATSKKKQYAGIIYIFVDHMIREDGAAGVHYSGPVHSPPYTLRGYIRYHDRCHTSGISLLSIGVLTQRLVVFIFAYFLNDILGAVQYRGERVLNLMTNHYRQIALDLSVFLYVFSKLLIGILCPLL